MQLTKFTDYSLRILIHLANVEGARLSARQIAEAQKLSFSHLAKAAQFLATEGYVNAARGRTGGMTLARPATEISIGAIVRKGEAGSAIVECFRADGGACLLTPACGLAPYLAEAREVFLAHLDGVTLAHVLARQPSLGALLSRLEGAEDQPRDT